MKGIDYAQFILLAVLDNLDDHLTVKLLSF